MVKDYYRTLEVRQGATPDEIKRAYRRLALRHHPVKSRDPDAHARFVEIGEANEILSDASKRSRYDALLASVRSRGTEQPAPATPFQERGDAQYEEWVRQARERYQAYAKVPFERFYQGAIQATKQAAHHTFNVWNFLFGLLMGGACSYYAVANLVTILSGEAFWGTYVGVLFLVFFAFGGFVSARDAIRDLPQADVG